MTEYVSTTETAKLVRAALKKNFPGVKFSVRSDSYAGGSSVRVRWTDGPQVDAVSEVVKPYSGAGFDGMIDLKTHNRHWLYKDGHVELFQARIGHSYGSSTFDAEGSEIHDKFARDYRYGVASVAGETLASSRDVDITSLGYEMGQKDAAQRLADGARLVSFMADYIDTTRDMGPQYRAELEHAVVFLAGEDGPFDGSRRYEFEIIPEGEQAGRAYCDYGHTLVYQLSRTDPAMLASALRDEASRRASNTVTLFNAGHADDRTGYYVTAQCEGWAGALLGPYAAREEAAAEIDAARRLAGQYNGAAGWHAFGVGRFTVKPGAAFTPGTLERLPERQMAAARITRPHPRAA